MDLANDITALVAGGDVIIDGAGPSASRFKGIVFAEGSIEFKRTTVIGASISADPQGSVVMDEVAAANAPETNAVVIEKDITLSEGLIDVKSLESPGSDPLGVVVGGTFTKFGLENESVLKATAADIASNTTPYQFVIRTPSGDKVVEPPFTGIGRGAKKAYGSWETYVSEHKAGNIKRIDVFDLDLNRALSITDALEVKYRRSRPYRNK